MEKNSKTKKKKMTKSQFQKKVLKTVLFAYILFLIVNIAMDKFGVKEKNIYEKIGYMSPYSVTMKDALQLELYGPTKFADYIKMGNKKAAYNMYTEEYRKMVSYDEFLKKIENIDFETFDMKQIKMKAQGTFVATVVYDKNGVREEENYLLYLDELNPEIITISPESFIYTFEDLNFKMDGIKLNVKKCDVYIDNIKLVATLKNNSLFDTMTFTNMGLGYGEAMNSPQNVDITLKPGEEQEIELEYEANYYVPDNIKIKRVKDDDTLRTYTFYFDKAK